MAESFSVKAILSAVDKGFTSTFSKAERLVEQIASQCEKSTSSTAKLTSGFKSMAAAIGVTQAVSAAFDLLSDSIDSAVSRYDTLNCLYIGCCSHFKANNIFRLFKPINYII